VRSQTVPLPRRDASLSLVSEVDPFLLSFQRERPLRSFERLRERALEVIRHKLGSVVDNCDLIDSGIALGEDSPNVVDNCPETLLAKLSQEI
jgi:hypothetical protein